MLAKEQLESYREHGYILLDSIFSDEEIEECSSEYDAIFSLKRESDLEATWKGDWAEKSSDLTSVRISHILLLYVWLFKPLESYLN